MCDAPLFLSVLYVVGAVTQVVFPSEREFNGSFIGRVLVEFLLRCVSGGRSEEVLYSLGRRVLLARGQMFEHAGGFSQEMFRQVALSQVCVVCCVERRRCPRGDRQQHQSVWPRGGDHVRGRGSGVQHTSLPGNHPPRLHGYPATRLPSYPATWPYC